MVAVFILLGLFGFLGVGETLGLAENAGGSGFWPEGGAATALGCVGSAIWFFIGFEFACPMAEENRRPQRNIPLAPILDLVAIYILDSLFALAAARYADPAALAVRHAADGGSGRHAWSGGLRRHGAADYPRLVHHCERVLRGAAPACSTAWRARG